MTRITKTNVELACCILSAVASRYVCMFDIDDASELLDADVTSTLLAKAARDSAWFGIYTEELACAEAEALLRDGWRPGDDVTMQIPASDFACVVEPVEDDSEDLSDDLDETDDECEGAGSANLDDLD